MNKKEATQSQSSLAEGTSFAAWTEESHDAYLKAHHMFKPSLTDHAGWIKMVRILQVRPEPLMHAPPPPPAHPERPPFYTCARRAELECRTNHCATLGRVPPFS